MCEKGTRMWEWKIDEERMRKTCTQINQSMRKLTLPTKHNSVVQCTVHSPRDLSGRAFQLKKCVLRGGTKPRKYWRPRSERRARREPSGAVADGHKLPQNPENLRNPRIFLIFHKNSSPFGWTRVHPEGVQWSDLGRGLQRFEDLILKKITKILTEVSRRFEEICRVLRKYKRF